MDLDKSIFFLYVFLPAIVGALLLFMPARSKVSAWTGLMSFACSFFALLFLAYGLQAGRQITLRFQIIELAHISLDLGLFSNRLSFLFLMELISGFFLFRFFMEREPTTLVRFLLCLSKTGIVSILLCNNLMVLGVLQIACAILISFLIYFSANPDEETGAANVATAFFLTQCFAGLFLFGWSVLNNGSTTNELVARPVRQEALLWVALLFTLPSAPIFCWFGNTISRVPQVVGVCVTLFVSAVLFRHLQVGALVFVGGGRATLTPIILAGFVISWLAFVSAFTAKSSVGLFASMPQFLMGVALVAYGFLSAQTFLAGLAICALIPLLLTLMLSLGADGVRLDHRLQSLGLLFFGVLLGFPGTALFAAWGVLEERALSVGGALLVLSVVLWFTYLLTNILYFREILSVVRIKTSDDKKIVIGNWAAAGFLLLLMCSSWIVAVAGWGVQ